MPGKPDALIQIGPFTVRCYFSQEEWDRASEEFEGNEHLGGFKESLGVSHVDYCNLWVCPGAMAAQTFIHELQHFCFTYGGISLFFPAGWRAMEREEAVVDSLSMWMFMIMRDNPHLMEVLGRLQHGAV